MPIHGKSLYSKLILKRQKYTRMFKFNNLRVVGIVCVFPFVLLDKNNQHLHQRSSVLLFMLRKTCVERTLMITMKCREVSLSLLLLVTNNNIQNMQTFLYKNECHPNS